VSVGLATAVGLDTRMAEPAVRAGICRFRESPYRDLANQPQVMSLVPDEFLPTECRWRGRKTSGALRRGRILELGGMALAEAARHLKEPAPLFLALGEGFEPSHRKDPEAERMLRDLARSAGVTIDEALSRVFRNGGAGGLAALCDALTLANERRGAPVIVGAADSFFDLPRLDALDAEGRLSGRSSDGFIPGEAAAFLVLTTPGAGKRLGLEPLARVLGAAVGEERGHRYSEEPYRGDGLARTFQALFVQTSVRDRVRTVYAGLNGESFPAKEWGVAYLRSAEKFAPDLAIEHPADRMGDAGAALGLAMLVLAALGIRKGHCAAPCLVWSTSDKEARAAALLDRAG
jgi:3-oxoacyl-[acyl-carrier-protein] synthase-1